MDNTFIQEKLLPRLTFNPGLALTGFRTTRPRRLLYRGLQSLFLAKREELWLWANGRFRMRNGMAQGIVVIRERMIKGAQCKMRD